MSSANGPTVLNLTDLPGHVGKHLGPSEWRLIDQDQIKLFADATGDHQWIHLDPERAKSGPFGTTIAHGYLTLSLAPELIAEVLKVEGTSMVVNYGLNRVRFPAPVPSGSRVRFGAELAKVDEIDDGVQVTLASTFELEGSEKPACVAEIVFRFYK
jgi:acyl dehydratase